MARRRFFVPEVRRGIAGLTGSEAEHLVRVLRVEPGQVFEISDNRKVYLAEVSSARKSQVDFQVLEELPSLEPAVHIRVLASLIKFEKFELLIEKATELGVAVIQPIESIRSERGLAQAAQKRSERWQRIALEASQQARRAYLPEIAPTMTFDAAVRIDTSVRLLLDETAAAKPILSALPSTRSSEDHVALLLGPEGGWTDDERQRAMDAGWTSCSLGNNILRAETAAIAALAIVQAAWIG